MLSALRAQVNAELLRLEVNRRPALRRSDDPEALLATDLPLASSAETAEGFVRRLRELGWRVWPGRNGWLLLDAPVSAPEPATNCVPAGECGCCVSILRRHPDEGDASGMIRALVKAADAGRQPFERLCSQLHGQLAALLRRHEPLPSALLPYLCQAYHDLYDRRNQP